MTETGPLVEPTHAGARAASVKGTWAGALLLISSIVFVVLAGCFLMGAMMLVLDPPPWLPAGTRVQRSFWTETLSVILYIFAFGCGLCATALLFLGARTLLRVSRA